MSLLPDSAQLEALLGEEPRLRTLARALVDDPATADEAVHETLEWGAGRLLPKGGLRRYLGRAVRSRILNRLRSERRRQHHERQAAQAERVPPTVDVVAQAEILQELTAAVARLPEPYRSTIWLRYYEDLPPREIAERVDVPVDTSDQQS